MRDLKKKFSLLALLLLTALLLCGCKQNPSQEQLYAKLLSHFEERGYTCALTPLADADPQAKVPIYNATVWQRLMLDGKETVLVYFDESNRADYLSGLIDKDEYGRVAHFGLRFVLVYDGSDPDVLDVLDALA